LIAGFHKPDGGRIFIDEEDVTALSPEKRRLGFVPQNYMLFPHMTVAGNVEFGLKMHGIPPADRKRAVDEILELTGLTHLRERRPNTLSGGEQQKTALARALVIKPKILLLDEPLSALDVNTQKTLRGELKRLQRKLAVTTVHVTHNHYEAYVLADKLAVDDFVARFVGFENLFEGKVVEDRGGVAAIDIGGVVIEAVTPKRGRCTVGVRPDDVIVSKTPLRSSMRNSLKGKIADYIDVGSLVSLMVNVKGVSFVALITKVSFEEMKLRKGEEVHLAFKASAVHVM